MGYNAYMLDFNFKIAERNMAYARELLGSEYKGGDIVDALMDCGFGVERVEGGVDALWWEGDKYPSYIEDVLSKIAPAVEDGSYLDFIGEDTCIWELRFENGEMTVKDGKIVFS